MTKTICLNPSGTYRFTSPHLLCVSERFRLHFSGSRRQRSRTLVAQYGLIFGYLTLVLALREPQEITGCALLLTIPSTKGKDEREYSNDDHTRRLIVTGLWPPRRFLTRPEPAFFDELAKSIAHAVQQMPKLEYLDLEFNATHQGRHHSNNDFFAGPW